MISQQTLVLAGIFVYFGIGAAIAVSISMLSMGFAGKFEPMAIAVFFLWPAFYLLRIPGLVFILAGVGGAGLMTYLAYLAMNHFQ